MALDRIQLANFRNHEASRLDGARRFNLLIGANGAGKTNLLEALSLFAPGRGLRRAQLSEMARDDNAAQGFAIGADLVSGQTPVRLGTAVRPDRPGRRLVQASGAPLPAARLSEWLSVSWLTPAMDRLFTDSAGPRRRFLDRMALAVHPEHAAESSRYDRALRERNRLLSRENRPDPAWLDALEREMADAGAAVCAGRSELVGMLSDMLAQLPDAPFARPGLAIAPQSPADPAALARLWREGRGADRAAGRTLSGPHRDDLRVTMAATGRAASECSTGEQKALLIAIILAHAELAAGSRPLVLLLDEVAAHLDPVRREALFERLERSGAQVWMTGTERDPFTAIRQMAAVWEVEKGALLAPG
ncbi:DNA replication/repair protein RecF [Croceicoccus hydrothermalis]|uniref:DNA replication/repair protein RecF n=1 Tax=Croceicoccus hydrothermalis TaxID=2867964 RepID=UPI001EFA30BA|nr:DNA replication/repair protein RecF [Croceicoccus hydrothermalis]